MDTDLSDGQQRLNAKSIYASGTDVYVAEIDANISVIWQNGISIYFIGNRKNSMNSVFFL